MSEFYNVRDKFGRFVKLGTPLVNKRPKNDLVKRTKNNLVSWDYLVLDESSSMSVISQSTVSSVNEYIGNLASMPKKLKINSNIIVFSTEVGIIRSYDPKTFRNWVNGVDYIPHGVTALFDAIAVAIKHANSNSSNGDQVVITVITDGHENASVDYNLATIKSLIAEAKKSNYTINFIGAGDFLDVQAVAQGMGIFASNTINYTADNAGVKKVMNTLSNSRSASTVSYMDTGENKMDGFFSHD